MRKYIFEATTTVKDPTEVNWDDPFGDMELAPEPAPVAKVEPDKPQAKPGQTPAPELKRASRAATQAATAGMQMPAAAGELLSRLNVPEVPDDEEAVPEPVTPANLPSVISKEIAATDPSAVNPEWHAVANLPGNVSRAIRTLGKALFGAFTKTPTQDIVMIGNLGGQGPNSERDIRSVANWVVKHGRPVDTAAIDFEPVMPGYEAETKQYTAGGARFMLVRDEFGTYIYAWPESDSLDSVEQISGDNTNMRQLP